VNLGRARIVIFRISNTKYTHVCSEQVRNAIHYSFYTFRLLKRLGEKNSTTYRLRETTAFRNGGVGKRTSNSSAFIRTRDVPRRRKKKRRRLSRRTARRTRVVFDKYTFVSTRHRLFCSRHDRIEKSRLRVCFWRRKETAVVYGRVRHRK